jgi:hypothetical protein
MKQMTRFAAMFAILLMASTAIAQTNSNTQTVNLNATVAESLTISLGAVNTVNFTPVPGNATNAGDSPVSVTTTWILKPGRTAVGLYAITGVNKNSSRIDTLTFNLNLSSAAMQQLPADDYVGTMTLQAQATP